MKDMDQGKGGGTKTDFQNMQENKSSSKSAGAGENHMERFSEGKGEVGSGAASVGVQKPPK